MFLCDSPCAIAPALFFCRSMSLGPCFGCPQFGNKHHITGDWGRALYASLLYAGPSDKLVRLDPSRPPSLYSSPRRKPFRPVCAFGSITGGWPVLSRGVGTGWFSHFLLPAAYHRSNPPSPERPSTLYFVCTHIETHILLA